MGEAGSQLTLNAGQTQACRGSYLSRRGPWVVLGSNCPAQRFQVRAGPGEAVGLVSQAFSLSLPQTIAWLHVSLHLRHCLTHW